MRKFLLSILIAISTLNAIWADTWTDPNTGYTWTYRYNNGKVELYNDFDLAVSPAPTGALAIPSRLGARIVRSIGDGAFRGCSGLTSVTIPDSVTSIGRNAFLGCSGLTNVTIPEGITSIGEYAFSDCSKLVNVMIPDSVTSIGKGAFHSCSGLTSLTLSNNITNIGSWAFCYCYNLKGITIPSGVTEIGDDVFFACSDLTSITIPTGVTNIGDSAFAGCSHLRTVSFKGNAPQIGASCFEHVNEYCTVYVPKYSSGWDVSIPGTWQGMPIRYEPPSFTIANGCLMSVELNDWTEVTIPASVTSIGNRAFSGCGGLTGVVLPASVTNIGEYAFADCDGLMSLTVLDKVTAVGQHAFTGCMSLSSVYISNIGAWCGISFADPEANPLCYGRKLYVNGNVAEHLTIPDDVDHIGAYAFYNCTNIVSVMIPNVVASIGHHAFYNCEGLRYVSMLSSLAQNLQGSIFEGCNEDLEITNREVLVRVDFDANGGLIVEDVLYVDYGTEVGQLPEPTRIGYTFLGWFTSQTGGNEVTEKTKVTNTQRYFAHWECDWVCATNYDGSLSITRPTKLNNETFDIPKTLDGHLVTGIGDYAFSDCGNMMSVTIPDSVTSIGSSAFSGCSRLTNVTIPNSVTSIGAGAFSGCSGLEETTLPFVGAGRNNTGNSDSLFGYIFGTSSYAGSTQVRQVLPTGSSTFYIPSSLKSVTISYGVTSIGPGSFNGCSSLTSVTIPDSVTSIGEYAFASCRKITEIEIPSCVTNIASSAFRFCDNLKSVVIPEGVKSLEDSLFEGCSRLTNVVFSSKLNYIGSYVFYDCKALQLESVSIPEEQKAVNAYTFYGCRNLRHVTIPSGIECIDEGAFEGCEKLEDVILPVSLGCLGSNAFRYCKSLVDINIPEGVSYIGDWAFAECSALRRVTLPSSVVSLGRFVFSRCASLIAIAVEELNPNYCSMNGLLLSNDKRSVIYGVNGNVEIPEGVENIEEDAFHGLENLTNVIMPNGVKIIGGGAFYDCCRLQYIVIPESVKQIGLSAFMGCKTLRSVMIPHGVERIEDNAFSGCEGLSQVVLSDGVTYIGTYAFYNCNTLPSIDIPGSIINIDNYAFVGCGGLLDVVIFDGVERIGAQAFNGCSNLMSVTLPSTIMQIGESAFAGCNEVGSVTVPGWKCGIQFDSVTNLAISVGTSNIEDNAFRGCTMIKNLSIPNGVSVIGDSAFRNCSGLAKVTIPNSVTNIGASAFSGCSGLTNLAISDAITYIEDSTFAGCSMLAHIVIPDSVTSLGTFAFSECYSLADVAMPVGVTNIDNSAFYNCTNLVNLTLPEKLRRIGASAFYNCRKVEGPLTVGSAVGSIGDKAFCNCIALSDISFPYGVTNIGYEAFAYCHGLKSVTVPGSVRYLGEDLFYDCMALQDVFLPQSYSGTISGLPSRTVVHRYKVTQTVTLNPNGGTVSPDAVLVDYRTTYRNLPTPVRIGYTFLGWHNGNVVVTADSVVDELIDHTLVARWAINSHIVKFDSNGGYGGWENTMNYGTSVTAPTVWRNGYTFNGWLPSVLAKVPDYDVKYIAQWEINRYNVTFNANGGIGGKSVQLDYDSLIVAPEVSRVGYTFTGWSPAVPATVPTNDATYTAQWQINTHTVTFDANGGSGGWSEVRDYGTAIVAPTATRTGYTFKGWLPEVAATVPDENVSYAAQWEANTYTVSFDPNGGNLNGGAESKDVVFDSAYGELPTPVLEFCTFDGWMMGYAAIAASTKVATAANHTLVAKWSRWGARIASSAVSPGKTLRELYPDDYANLTTVVLEEGVAELPEGFFGGCDNVENLTLPESLETLGYDELPKKIRESLEYGSEGFMVYQGWVLGYRDDGASALTLPQGVKGIGTRAFAEFWDLETVVIPDTVKRIGRGAFFECTFLDDVNIPDSVVTIGTGAFENCSYMQTLSVGTGVRKVADHAFARCASLQAVAFADGLESVGECAFSNDWRMLSVSLPHSVTNIGDGAFAACKRVKGVAVPANVMTLADMFPVAYTNIESAVVAVGETDIMDDMFNGCGALVDFTWSGSETNVGERAFLGCEALESVAMPDSVERIGSEAFKGCSSLHDFTLSRSLAALPDYAFAQCGSLDSFIVPASVTSLGECIVEDSAVSAIYYLGNAPEYDPNAYHDAAAGLVTYVVRGTRGWDGTPSSRVLPEDWISHEITYWTPNRFDVTFDANGGYFGESSVTQWSEQQITDMGYVLPNQNPVRPGYAFEGWWTESTAGAQVKYSTQVTATKPHSLYAHWRLLGSLVTATFNANGGAAVIPGSQSYVAGQTFGAFPIPSRTGYAFEGWWTEAVGGDRITEASGVPTADTELFAHWSPIQYFIAYDANGGTGAMTNQVLLYDTPKVLDENLFSRPGYAFSGWARSADGQVEYADRAEVVNLAEISNAVVTLYAVWSGAGYNVRFDSNGGTGVMENQTIQIGETQNLHTNAFAFSGREFLGWATESGGAVAYMDGEAVSDLASANGATVHLYAVWHTSNATWRVSFDGNGGSVVPMHWNVARGVSLDALPTPTRPGHAFMGWWTQRAGGASVTPPFVVTGDMSLYAHWRAYDDSLPPVSGNSGVAAVMGDSADLRLGENVKTVDEYNALVEWADTNGISHQAVRTSLHVWASYVLGAGTLLENAPEIVIGEVGVSENGVMGITYPSVTVCVTVKDGGEAIAVDAVKVASMFEATSDLDDWDGATKLPISAEAVETANVGNGYSMRFQVTLPVGAERAFMRIRR